MKQKYVTKAVIAAAGLGTRFLPQTKAMPKEMLPIIDKPVIQLIVEEAVSAGVTDIIIVTGAQKRAIEDHFDRSTELEQALLKKGKTKEAKEIREIAQMANFAYVRQKGSPAGNARPVINSAHLLDGEPFFLFFADDFFQSKTPRATQLLEVYQKTGKSVLSMFEVNKNETRHYGMVKPGARLNQRTVEIAGLVEKPAPDKAPSLFATSGGYLLTPEILKHVTKLKPSIRGELEITDAIIKLAKVDKVYGHIIDGKYQDAGSKEGHLRAVIDAAIDDPKLGPVLVKYLRKRLNS